MTRHRWRYPALVFALLWALLLTWTIGTPLFAAPDEPGHLYKAYATAHFQTIGEPIDDALSNIRRYDVPAEMGVPPNIRCFVFLEDVSAGCVEPGTVGAGESTAAVYPPFWYALVGGGARLVDQATSQRTYRAMAGALCAMLVTAAFVAVRRSRSRRFAPLLLLGLTPMALFLSASVNPNGFEVAAFVLLWALCLHAGHPRAPTARGGLVVGALLAMVLCSRVTSIMWVLAGTVVVVLALGGTGVRPFLNRRFLVPALGLAALAELSTVVWTRWAGAEIEDPRIATELTTSEVISTTWRNTPEYLRQMIGILGWLDTRLPWFVYLLFAIFTAVVVAGVVWSRDRRLIVAAVAAIGGVIVIPFAINITSAASAGIIWQGRYTLPLYASLSLLGILGWTAVGDRRPDLRLGTAVGVVAVVCFAVAEVAAFWQMLRRFSVGAGGKIWLVQPLGWSPAIAPMLLIALNACLVGVLSVVLVRAAAVDPGDLFPIGADPSDPNAR